MSPRLSLFAFLLLIGIAVCAGEGPVRFQSVEVTFQSGTSEDLKRTTDPASSSRGGWSVGPRIAENHAAIFRTAEPLDADLVKVTLTFSSGKPNRAIAEFALSATADKEPSFKGHWEPITIVHFRATNAELGRVERNHLRAAERREDDSKETGSVSYGITARMPFQRVTGLRLEAFPIRRASGDHNLRMAWNPEGDFVLTQFRLEVAPGSTNLALGSPVRASHPVESYLTPEALTDGVPYSLVHPRDPNLGAAFFFEIDLGSVRAFDHLALRQRNDQWDINRFSRIIIHLYDREPGPGIQPCWKAIDRADGSHPEVAGVDVLRAVNGEGQFRGRYIRLSSDSPVPKSPQLAEVEVYETRTPVLASPSPTKGRALRETCMTKWAPGSPSWRCCKTFLPAKTRSLNPLRKAFASFPAPPGR